MVDCRERHQSGNIFFALFGVVALIGVLGAGVMTFIKGPLTTSVNLTKSNATENSMQIAAQVAVMSSATSAGSGDCDSDTTIEPIEWRAATTQPYPAGGGLIPLSLGTKTKDSWGTEFGYCVWNHGSTTSGSGCGANLLAGTNAQSYPVVALVSAGPDKVFTTTCRSFATADVNSDGDLADAGDLALVSKASSNDDDIIYTYSYEDAISAAGGLWGLKSTDPDAATISKDIEVTGDASSTGTGSFSGGILLPDTSEVTCDSTTAGVMARSTSGTGIELCDGTAWQVISGDCTDTSTGAISYIGSSTAHTGGNGTPETISVSSPSGVNAGDLLLYGISSDGCGTLTWPSGFTELHRQDAGVDGQCWAVAYKVATGSETTLSFSDSMTWGITGTVIAYSGVDTSAPINASSSSIGSSSVSTSWVVDASTITPTVNNAKLVWFGSSDTDGDANGYSAVGCAGGTLSFTPPAGYTERIDVQGTTPDYACYDNLTFADYTQTTAAATGTVTGTMNSTYSGNAVTGAMLFALAPSTTTSSSSTPAIEQNTGWVMDGSGVSVTSLSQSFSTLPSAGNSILVFATFDEVDVATNVIPFPTGVVTDNQGNTYSSVVYGTSNRTNNPFVYIANNIAAPTGTFTITVDTNGDAGRIKFYAVEVSGLSSSPVDITATNSNVYTTTNTVTPAAPAATNGIYFAFSTSNLEAMTASSGWAAQTTDNTAGYPMATINYQTFSSSASTPITWTTGTSDDMDGVVLALAASSSSSSCSSSTLSDIQLSDETVNTTCDSTNLGLLRYNTAGTSSSMTAGGSGGSSGSISFVGSNVGYVGGSGGTVTVDVTAPAGIQADDLLLYVVNSDGADYNNMTWPSGFTPITGGNSGSPDGQDWAVAYKIATGSETTLSVSDAYCYGITATVLAYRGVDTASPIHQYSTAVGASSAGSSWTVSADSVTPTVDGTQLVWIGVGDPAGDANGFDANGGSCPAVQAITHTPPSGYTERIDIQGNGVDFTCYNPLSVADMSQTTAAATGIVSGTATSLVSGTSRPGAMLLSLRPLSSGGGGSSYSSDYTSSNYVEVCDGTSWTVVGRNALNDLTDVITNYTGAVTESSNSLYSMFLGDGSGINAAALSQYNTALGYQSMYSLMSGEGNTAMGYQSLYSNTIGDNNSAFGSGALYSGVTAANNSAFGYNALYTNTGDANTAFGSGALYFGGAKYGNTAIGYWSMYYADSSATSSAAYNTAIGFQSLMGSSTASANTGTLNTALGAAALTANTTGSYNSAAGYGAMETNTTGSRNTALGYEALYTNATGSDVTAIGYQALRSNTGAENTALGAGALYSGAARTQNTAIGYNAMYYASNSATTAAANNTAIGGNALRGSSASNANSDNTAIGAYALSAATTGSYNTAAGAYALGNSTIAAYNVAAGYYAANSLRKSSYNTAIGYTAMQYIYNGTTGTTNGYNNTAVGSFALRGNTTGAATNTANSNVAVGGSAMVYATTAAQSVAVGYQAGQANTTGTVIAIGHSAIGQSTANSKSGIGIGYGAAYNQRATSGTGIGIGDEALYTSSGTSSANDNNIGIGYRSLYTTNGAAGNVGIGYQALYGNTTGNNNTAIGYQAGYAGTANTTGSTNTFIGYQAQANGAGYSNGMAIGNGAVLTASNRIVLGNTSIAGIRAQVTSITAISDRRHKKDIEDLDLGLSFINTLYPVSYRYNNGDDTLRYGFIAQDIEKALPDKVKPLVNKNVDGLAMLTREDNDEKTYRVNLGEMIAPLVKAVQELDKKFEVLLHRFEDFAESTKSKIASLFEDEKKLQAKREIQDKEIAELEAKIQGLKLSCVAAKESGHD